VHCKITEDRVTGDEKLKVGIIGLPQSGKRTIFRALTGSRTAKPGEETKKGDQPLVTVNVPDERVDYLCETFKPKKTVYAQIGYLLPTKTREGDSTLSQVESVAFKEVRTCDGLIQVIRNFQLFGGPAPVPEQEFFTLRSEMILADLMVTEKRIEGVSEDARKGRKIDITELSLLERCRDLLNQETPLRDDPEIAASSTLKGFTFLSAKPLLLISNNSDENEDPPRMAHVPQDLEIMVVRGKLEMEIAEMAPEEAEEFLSAFHIERFLLDRVIRRSLAVSNRISFFTIVENEVRSWITTKGTCALDAADLIHSDMKKGFIRAEVLSYDELVKYGGFSEAKKDGHLRLEGKDYVVQDGDIVKFRFSV
jgi:ribosome-binding ATPase YchF (GTP1/OBG family)